MYKRVWHLLSVPLWVWYHQDALAFSDHLPCTRCGIHAAAAAAARSGIPLRSTSHELEDCIPENNVPSLTPSKRTELWLDLRSTAIHPKAAMEYLESQLGSSTHFVDRILLSEQAFQNLIDYSDLYIRTSRILYQNSENNAILAATGDGLSVPFGRFLPFPSNNAAVVVEDPIHAIQIISAGRWLVLGNENDNVDHEQECKRLDGIRNFLEIACTASGAGAWGAASGTTKGLMLPTVRSDARGGSTAHGVGGVAIKCYSSSALMKLASAILLMEPGLMTSVTNSGIVIQETDDEPASISTAIILPFDVEMWEASVLVFPQEDILNLKDYE
jgi:hypothetical protein